MSVEKALIADLTNQIGVGTRIYPLKIPQGAIFPCVVFNTVTNPRHHAFQADATLTSPRIRFIVYGQTYTSAKTVADSLIARLKNKTGTLGSGTNTVTGVAILTESQSEYYDDDMERFAISVDFRIHHEGSV